MRKLISITTALLLAFLVAGCEKLDENDQIMQSFYESSCQLNEL